ncbi:short chain dehydrogenase [Coccidioides immitis RS]|uniref:Short chain dehydrogenase n=1 Tax=Coccidioides immitis (strain RS) TaxID=246410 RepID=J3KFN5_COCIM|nr:short chain dehydrogenase [Coccidioides immitis RS]EAS34452.3 short chain dehydrogenase [Coccidioides immitis RS]TPX21888.1 hypothetical protein DIZ76_015853 [Coccidioides immitis]
MAAYTGKNVVIIGGTQGIGLATAKLFLSHGAKVVVTGRRREPVAAAKQELGAAALVLQSDITSLDAHANLERLAEQHLGSGEVIDLLFLNVGYANLSPVSEMTEDLFDRHFNTNTRGPIFLAKRMIPHMRPGGAIVFTTSVSVDQGHPGMAVYSASKAAIYSFVQTLAAELARGKDGKEGIRVNCVSPGFVDTPTLGVVDAPKEAVAAFADLGRQSTPLARIARPEEVAKAVAFLGFDATFTTGTEFLMDGGLRHLVLAH